MCYTEMVVFFDLDILIERITPFRRFTASSYDPLPVQWNYAFVSENTQKKSLQEDTKGAKIDFENIGEEENL